MFNGYQYIKKVDGYTCISSYLYKGNIVYRGSTIREKKRYTTLALDNAKDAAIALDKMLLKAGYEAINVLKRV